MTEEKPNTLILALDGDVSSSTMGLTGVAKSQTRDIAQQMINAGIIPDAIAYSPIKRSEEGAKLFRDAFQAVNGGKEIPLIAERSLSSQSPRAEVVNGFNEGFKTVLAVGGKDALIAISNQFSRKSPLQASFNDAGKYRRAEATALTMDTPKWGTATRATPRQTFKPATTTR